MNRPRLEIPLLILFALFLSSSAIYPQEQHPQHDSLAHKAPSFSTGDLFFPPAISLPWSFRTNPESPRAFLLQPSPATGPENLPGFLRLSLAQPMQSYLWDSDQKMSLASCWRNDLLLQREYDTFRMILGTVEAGGAAYLMYKHLRKYGLK